MKENKLIAEFLGKDHELNQCISAPQFHKSWDWLMPVVSKCHEIDESSIRLEIGHKNMYGANIDIVHEAVVEFITQYNKEK